MEKIFGKTNVTDAPHNLLAYSYDATEADPSFPDFVVLPENVEQVVAVVRLASEERFPLVPYITGNNIGGLTIPEHGGVLLDFGKKMNRVLLVHESHMYALLEPGVTFGQLNRYLLDHHPSLRYSYPFAPPHSRVVGNAILSGMNNMSSVHGSMGDWINGLEVVTHDGSVVRVGSCFSTREFSPNNWHSRYPMPDLLGLFVNWEGMTGIVTKCAVQLWPRKPIETALLAVTTDVASTADLMRQVARLELVDDVSTVSIEVAKMALGLPEPPKHEQEPPFAHIFPISAHDHAHLRAKLDVIGRTVDALNEKHGPRIQVVDVDVMISLVGERLRCFYDLPNVILPLVEYSGLTWVGTYAPPDELEALIEEANALFAKFGVPAFVYMKMMKGGHYAIFRPIIRFRRERELERTRALLEALLESALEHGCIPYKTPTWMTAKLRERIDPNWVALFERVKHFMDPRGIFNPGRWNT
ncbi:MAG: hypothetical protein Kow0069_18110 [Promethearchaeota archaeon]